ncbi:MAG: hypothetical protein Q7T71_19195 [Herbiconiux sp.]|nr:hypothetical protein [Herbiconiux sp.]
MRAPDDDDAGADRFSAGGVRGDSISALRITVARTGGVAGIRPTWSVTAEREADVDSWLSLVESCPWDASDADTSTGAAGEADASTQAGEADRFVYTIRVVIESDQAGDAHPVPAEDARGGTAPAETPESAPSPVPSAAPTPSEPVTTPATSGPAAALTASEPSAEPAASEPSAAGATSGRSTTPTSSAPTAIEHDARVPERELDGPWGALVDRVKQASKR